MPDEFLVPDMAMLHQYHAFFIARYIEAGMPDAKARIMRAVNQYDVYLFCKKQLDLHERERLEQTNTIKTDKEAHSGLPVHPSNRPHYHKTRGKAKRTRDLYHLFISQLPSFDSFLASLPPIQVNEDELPESPMRRRRTIRTMLRFNHRIARLKRLR